MVSRIVTSVKMTNNWRIVWSFCILTFFLDKYFNLFLFSLFPPYLSPILSTGFHQLQIQFPDLTPTTATTRPSREPHSFPSLGGSVDQVQGRQLGHGVVNVEDVIWMYWATVVWCPGVEGSTNLYVTNLDHGVITNSDIEVLVFIILWFFTWIYLLIISCSSSVCIMELGLWLKSAKFTNLGF